MQQLLGGVVFNQEVNIVIKGDRMIEPGEINHILTVFYLNLCLRHILENVELPVMFRPFFLRHLSSNEDWV
jgi:hypothetical protein